MKSGDASALPSCEQARGGDKDHCKMIARTERGDEEPWQSRQFSALELWGEQQMLWVRSLTYRTEKEREIDTAGPTCCIQVRSWLSAIDTTARQ